MRRYESYEDLQGKIDWEGGIASALEYGIKSAQMPTPELEAAWREMEAAFAAFRVKVDVVEGILEGGSPKGALGE